MSVENFRYVGAVAALVDGFAANCTQNCAYDVDCMLSGDVATNA